MTDEPTREPLPKDIHKQADFAVAFVGKQTAIYVVEGRDFDPDDVIKALGLAVNHYLKKRGSPLI